MAEYVSELNRAYNDTTFLHAEGGRYSQGYAKDYFFSVFLRANLFVLCVKIPFDNHTLWFDSGYFSIFFRIRSA